MAWEVYWHRRPINQGFNYNKNSDEKLHFLSESYMISHLCDNNIDSALSVRQSLSLHNGIPMNERATFKPETKIFVREIDAFFLSKTRFDFQRINSFDCETFRKWYAFLSVADLKQAAPMRRCEY